jgi:SAM-dependent methyltransferase
VTIPAFRNLLYREPRLYDLIFQAADESIGRMVLTAMDRWLSIVPRSMLDLGCGTGRLLQALAKTFRDCYGVDLLESNIAYARSARPCITFRVGDMRTVRLGRTFDLVTCVGNALSYALSDDELMDTMHTFAAHAHRGALLVVDPLNARAYLEGHGFQERIEGRVDAPGSRRHRYLSTSSIDRLACSSAPELGTSSGKPMWKTTRSIGFCFRRRFNGCLRRRGSRCAACTTTESSSSRT